MNLAALKRDLAKIRARLEPVAGAGSIHIPRKSGMAGLRAALMAVQARQGAALVAFPIEGGGLPLTSPFKTLRARMTAEKARRNAEALPPLSVSTPASTTACPISPQQEENRPCQTVDAP
jgi:hypothetical protein